jgi:hypothetical protein
MEWHGYLGEARHGAQGHLFMLHSGAIDVQVLLAEVRPAMKA